MYKNIIIIVSFIFLSLSASAQSFSQFVYDPIDEYNAHDSYQSMALSNGNVVMLDFFHQGDAINGFTLLKLNDKAELIDSTLIFPSSIYDSITANHFNVSSIVNILLIQHPYEENCNIFSCIYPNLSDLTYHYNAIFFDNDLNINNIVDVSLPLGDVSISDYEIVLDNDNNFILCVTDGISEDYIFVRMNLDGEILNYKQVDLTTDEYTYAVSSERKPLFVFDTETLQYGCLFVRTSRDNRVAKKMIVVFDENFEFVKEQDVHILVESLNVRHDISLTPIISLQDGHFLMVMNVLGLANSGYSGKRVMLLLKIDKGFNIIDYNFFEQTVPGEISFNLDGQTLAECIDGTEDIYLRWRMIKLISGYQSQTWVYRFDSELNLRWKTIISDRLDLFTESIAAMPNGGLVCSGAIGGMNNNFAAICFVINNDGTFTSEYPSSSDNLSIYPNPARDVVKISSTADQPSVVKVYNCLGMLVEEFEMTSEEIEINVSDYNPGVYFFNINGEVVKVIKN